MTNIKKADIGILALQGGFLEHQNMLESIGVKASLVRKPEQLLNIDGLIIPGGESTAIARLCNINNFKSALHDFVKQSKPVWGTCAGAILLANEVVDFPLGTFELLPITIKRNAFGSQIDSFTTNLNLDCIGLPSFPGVFIRAPIISSTNSNVKVLASLANEQIIAVSYNNIIATSFHPELTRDTRFHQYFLSLL